MDSRTDYWRSRAISLEKELHEARKTQTAVDVLVDQIQSLAPDSYDPAPPAPVFKKRGSSSPQSAVLLFSDTHVGLDVSPDQTLGFGGYNFPTFLRRLKRLEESVGSILQDHTTTEISELVIPMIGDMIDGALTHSAEVAQVNTLFTQFYAAGHAIAQFLRNLSALVPKIRIYTAVGNHPRWGTQKKMPTKNRFSNLDQFLYAYIQSLTRDIEKIHFNLDQQPLAEFKVQGFNFLAGHGDHLRGGDKALGIPSHSLGRQISAAAQLRLKFERPGVNYYCFGHLHMSTEITHCLGDVLINGGFPGIDTHATMSNYTTTDPVQKLFFMHPRHGRAACYSLNLKWAKTDGPLPYEIPGGFSIV